MIYINGKPCTIEQWREYLSTQWGLPIVFLQPAADTLYYAIEALREPKPTPEIDVKLFMVRDNDIHCLMRQCPVCHSTVMVTVEVENVVSKGIFRRVWDRIRRMVRLRKAK